MVGLLDIAPSSEVVEVRGKKIEVTGISAKGLIPILVKFPELRKMMAEKEVQIDPNSILQSIPDAVAIIIAAGTGTPGDDQAEQIAAKLSVGEQLELLTRIWKVTFPRGVKNFIEALNALAEDATAVSGWTPDTKSPGPSKS